MFFTALHCSRHQQLSNDVFVCNCKLMGLPHDRHFSVDAFALHALKCKVMGFVFFNIPMLKRKLLGLALFDPAVTVTSPVFLVLHSFAAVSQFT